MHLGTRRQLKTMTLSMVRTSWLLDRKSDSLHHCVEGDSILRESGVALSPVVPTTRALIGSQATLGAPFHLLREENT